MVCPMKPRTTGRTGPDGAGTASHETPYRTRLLSILAHCRAASVTFLNRLSQVQILPGAPVDTRDLSDSPARRCCLEVGWPEADRCCVTRPILDAVSWSCDRSVACDCSEAGIEGEDRGRPMDQRRVEHHHIRESQPGRRSQLCPADRRLGVQRHDLERCAQRRRGVAASSRRRGVVENSQPRGSHQAPSERDRMEQDGLASSAGIEITPTPPGGRGDRGAARRVQRLR